MLQFSPDFHTCQALVRLVVLSRFAFSAAKVGCSKTNNMRDLTCL